MGALEALHIAVGDVLARYLVGAGFHNGVLDKVLNFLNVHRVTALQADFLHLVRDINDLLLGQALVFCYNVVGLGDRRNNFGNVEYGFAAVALDDFHTESP